MAGGPRQRSPDRVKSGFAMTAVGLNYIDTYHRSGLYSLPMPSGLGSEAAGVVEEIGPVSPG